jgi:hypothetical protein
MLGPILCTLAVLLACAQGSTTSPDRETSDRCEFDPAAIARLDPPDQCAVHALSETCDDGHRCYADCIVAGSGLQVGGGCAHLCGLVELSHAFYDCFPGSREMIEATLEDFVIVNDSDESIRVELHYEKAAIHRTRETGSCLDVDVRLAPREQLGQDAYLVDDQGRLLVHPIEPKLEGTTARCTVAVEIPPRQLLLLGTEHGYWFREIARADVQASAGSYSFSHRDVPRFDPPAESVFEWYVWHHPPRRP